MAFSEEMIQQTWEKARGMTELGPEDWRRDECGAWIRREHYGHAHSEFGWKIVNVSLGGPDVLDNLRPFHHANDFDRATRRARCMVAADQTGVPVTGHLREPRNRAA
jgi:hypothetical protein